MHRAVQETQHKAGPYTKELTIQYSTGGDEWGTGNSSRGKYMQSVSIDPSSDDISIVNGHSEES